MSDNASWGHPEHKLSGYTALKEQREQRVSICKSCDRLSAKINVCKECGCFMPVKTWMSFASCPKGKW
jgi:hypothetical protein